MTSLALDWIGVLIFIGVVIYQIVSALRGGNVEEDEPSSPSYPPPRPSTTPQQAPQKKPPQSIEELLEALGKEKEPPRQAPPPMPTPLPKKTTPAYPSTPPKPKPMAKSPARPKVEPEFQPLDLLKNADQPVFETEVSRHVLRTSVEQDHFGKNIDTAQPEVVTRPGSDRLDALRQELLQGVHDTQDLRRAILLKEILDTPLGLRFD